uniref:SGNH hydrolase-type esterase domain-containing protein n=1 Tax=Fagus sylvatica TaxID=28930 RepID=A0A2N9FIK5_FAGSY
MGRTFMLLVVVCIFFFFTVESQAQIVPALYVFGDSFVVSGNDNPLDTDAKANYAPYGIDFPNGPTGRVTNGLTIADFFAQLLGIQVPPPFLLVNATAEKFYEGFNYASGSAGIRSETGTAGQEVTLSMEKQIELFRKTVQEYLPSHFSSAIELKDYLSKSIFLVIIGSNDYSHNYLSTQYNSSRIYNMKQFADLLTYGLEQQLQELYLLGARKFVVFEIDAMGCEPAFLQIEKSNPKCSEKVNSYIGTYNHKLGVMLERVGKAVVNSTFVLAKRYQIMNDLVANPTRYGESSSLPFKNPLH